MISFQEKKNFIVSFLLFQLLSYAGYCVGSDSLTTQKSPYELRLNLNDAKTHYVRLSFLNQTWVRWNESNPGTRINGYDAPTTFDVGLRRTRLQLFGQLSDRVFFYMQFGQNNFTTLSARKTGAFFHDVVGEYAVVPRNVSLGAGLMGWTGPGRFSSPSVASVLGYDAPLFEQATNDVTDQFLRRLGVYAKGKVSRLDYRFALATPFAAQTASNPVPAISTNSNFSYRRQQPQSSGYAMLQLLDEEPNTIPYTNGTWLGKKRVFNIGAGFVHQPKALWRLNEKGDTIEHNLNLFAVDVFYDAPLNTAKTWVLTGYGALFISDFGPNYVRNLGVMNPANGTNPKAASFNGAGNAFPMEGTGTTLWLHGGVLLPAVKSVLLQPWVAYMRGDFEALHQPVNMVEGGINWLINGHNAKICLAVQNRPIFSTADATHPLPHVTAHKNMYVLQYQVFI